MSSGECDQRPKIKRYRTSPTHRWNDKETRSLLEEVRKEVRDHPESFEKQVAQKFYTKVSNRSAFLARINWSVMKSKMRYLKGTYMEAVKWRSQTGTGLIENANENSVQKHVQEICPFFEALDEIFGQRKGVNPEVLLEDSDQLL